MTRPAILTEAQLRAAVAVAEASVVAHETLVHLGDIGYAIMQRPEFLAIKDWRSRYDAAMPAKQANPEWVVADKAAELAEVTSREAVQEWMKVRPSTPYEVRAGETLARIVADHTDGGTDPYAVRHDTGLSTILREFEGLTARDGVR